MKNLKKILICLTITFCTSKIFANVDIEFPLKFIVGETKISQSTAFASTATTPFPLPFFGPLRAHYLFEDCQRWTFGLGGSAYLWPFQSLALSGKAIFTIKTFKNSNSLELVNILDLGMTGKGNKYFNAEEQKNTFTYSVAPGFEYTLMLNYRWGKWSAGFGPSVGFSAYGGNIIGLYNVNASISYALSRKK